jgi:uncharacterized protein YkwD
MRSQGNSAPGVRSSVAAASQLTAGRVGEAVVARPGNVRVTGHGRRTSGRAALPPAVGRAVGAEQSCADADMQPTTANLSQAADVVLCLMNAMRQNSGVPDLKLQAQLTAASVAHSQDMVDHKYFAHDSLDGRDVVARLTNAKYIPADAEWVIGENLAWGSGALASPRALVNAWMNSPPHRENLLSPDFREVGMGLVLGTPSKDASDGVTATTDFGTRAGGAGALGLASTGTSPAPAASSDTQARAAKRRAALRRCNRKSGAKKRRCVRSAGRIR